MQYKAVITCKGFTESALGRTDNEAVSHIVRVFADQPQTEQVLSVWRLYDDRHRELAYTSTVSQYMTDIK